MEREVNIFSKRLESLEETVFSSNSVLESLLSYQISLETQLQELIRSNSLATIPIKSATKIDFIPIKEIIYLKADLSYTEIVSKNHSNILATKSINDFENKFSLYPFYRISKSILINIKQVHSYHRKNNQVMMKNKDVLDVARRRKADFLTAILPNEKY